MNRLISLLLLSVFFQAAFATTQIKERVRIGEQELVFYERPLTQKISEEDFIKLFKNEDACSGLWRGYRGNWEIIKGHLYLVSVELNTCETALGEELEYLELWKIVEQYRRNSGARADWYNGNITIPISDWELTSYEFIDNSNSSVGKLGIIYTVTNGKISNRSIQYIDYDNQ